MCIRDRTENEVQTDCGIADNTCTSHLQFAEQKQDQDDLELEKENGVEEFYTRVKLKDDQCESKVELFVF